MYQSLFNQQTSTEETTTPMQAPRRKRNEDNEVSLMSEIINSGTEVFVATSSAIRTVRKAINLAETELDKQLVNSTFDLIEIVAERSNGNQEFINSYMNNRNNSRVRAL